MKLEGIQSHLLICNGKSCMRGGADHVTNAIRTCIEVEKLTSTVHTTRTLCNGMCKEAPVVIHYPSGQWFTRMTPETGKSLVHALAANEMYIPHLSHTYENDCFRPYHKPRYND